MRARTKTYPNEDVVFLAEQGYSVVLPEKLQTGKWNVYRLGFLILIIKLYDRKFVLKVPDDADLHGLL